MEASPGDRIIVESEQVGAPARQGEVVEVLRGSSGLRLRVRWNDGRETLYTPSVGSARVVPGRRRRRR